MRRLIAILVLLAAPLPATTAALTGASQRLTNPLQLNGQPLSCPDPDVFRVEGLHEYVAACTSNYGEDNPGGKTSAAFPMYVSKDLQHWQFRSFIFPPGRAPGLTLDHHAPPGYDGHYWSPEIHRIAGRWVVYFAAGIHPDKFARLNRTILPGTFGLFVAWTDQLFGGHWHSRLLHYTGQLNHVPHNPKELQGGVIDPSVARDPVTGTLYIAYAKQRNQIFVGQLSTDGLTMQSHVHLAFGANYPWECDPRGVSVGNGCTVEGPVLYADRQHGVLDMFFNSASTWRASYKVGVAVSADPMKTWVTYPKPILQSGHGLFGPGIGAQPVVGPTGSTYMFFHVQLHPSHVSQSRYLAAGSLRYVNGHQVLIRDPATSPTAGASAPDPSARPVPVPQVDGGVVERGVVVGP